MPPVTEGPWGFCRSQSCRGVWGGGSEPGRPCHMARTVSSNKRATDHRPPHLAVRILLLHEPGARPPFDTRTYARRISSNTNETPPGDLPVAGLPVRWSGSAFRMLGKYTLCLEIQRGDNPHLHKSVAPQRSASALSVSLSHLTLTPLPSYTPCRSEQLCAPFRVPVHLSTLSPRHDAPCPRPARRLAALGLVRASTGAWPPVSLAQQ